jgi:uncharacterized membrane protein YeaQ/YmgE (transglycosylase-associated protein family)
MHLLLFLIFGLIVGVLARLIVPGREPGGWLVSLAIGVAGSYLGGFLGRVFGMYGQGQAAGFLMSVFGAVVLLLCYHAIIKRRPASS